MVKPPDGAIKRNSFRLFLKITQGLESSQKLKMTPPQVWMQVTFVRQRVRITVILLLSEMHSHPVCSVIYVRACVYTVIYMRMHLSIVISTVCV